MLGLPALMPHPLESEYGLTAEELIEAINRRFRAKVAIDSHSAHLGMTFGASERKVREVITDVLVERTFRRPRGTAA